MLRRSFVALMVLALLTPLAAAGEAKRVLLLGMKRDHPPGTHEYMAGLNVLAVMLQKVPGLEVEVIAADEPWKEGPEKIKSADALVLYLGQGARWEQIDAQRHEALKAFAARGGAIVGLHWAIGAKDAKYIEGHLALQGGCHGGPDRKYLIGEADVKVVDPKHPIMRGLCDMHLKDEFYYRLKFAKQGKIVPLLDAMIEGKPYTVAWAFERRDGGRSFGWSGMHYHDNWRLPQLRRMIVQGVLWTLKMPVPEQGLDLNVPDEAFELNKRAG